MKTLKLLFAISLLFTGITDGFSQRLTSHSEISLLTCSPGTQEIYAHFGHSAIRVKDTTTNTDIVYNYGMFDFDTPNFYWKFIKGKLKYMLVIQPAGSFVQNYALEGREVKEEKLILDQKEKMDILKYLQWNYRPENRYYLYDFFYNNCSSKIWDVVKAKLITSYRFDTADYEKQSFRQMLYPYLQEAKWASFGIDILLGIPADKIASFQEQMFLPDYLSENMGHVLRDDPVKESRFILGSPNILTAAKNKENKSFLDDTFFSSPRAMGWLLFFHILGFSIVSALRFKKWFDIIYFTLLGLLSILLLFMWFGTDHGTMGQNLNLLWASPFAVVFVVLRVGKKFRIMNIFSVLLLISSLVVLLGWNILPQQFHPAVLPLTLLIPVRMIDNLLMYNYHYIFSEKVRSLVGRESKA